MSADSVPRDLASWHWGQAHPVYLQHPIFGRGFFTLYPATQQIFDNWYLYAVVETGVVGLGILLLFFVILICTARGARLRSADPEIRGLGQALRLR